MTTATTPETGATSRGWLRFLNRHRRETAIGLFLLAALLVLFPIWSGLHLGRDYLFVTIWGIIPPILTALAGLMVFEDRAEQSVQRSTAVAQALLPLLIAWLPGGRTLGRALNRSLSGDAAAEELLLKEVDEEAARFAALRLIALAYGSALGIWFVLLSGYLVVFQWWDTVFVGGIDLWRSEGWKFGITLGCFFAGLILIFVSVQLAQPEEAKIPSMRRALYGYNTVLTGILLLVILVILNVLSYTQVWPYKLLAEPADWTEKSFYKLSDASLNLLKGLDRPVRIYVLQSEDAGRNDDIQHLLDSCRAQTDKIEVEYLSRDRNRREIERLQSEYKEVAIGGSGLLVVYGPEGHQTAAFISEREMYPGGGMGTSVRFAGEDALMRWLSFLAEGRGGGTGDNSLKIYVTQGNGEPPLSSGASMGGMREQNALDELVGKMRDFHYTLAPLTLNEQTTAVPEDAEVVVVLPSRRPLPAAGVTALRKYVTTENAATKKKGKLLVLAEVQQDRKFQMFQTGIEPLVTDLGVEVSNEHILRIPEELQQLPENYEPKSRNDAIKFSELLSYIQVVPLESNANTQNKIAQAFSADTGTSRQLAMENVREVHGTQKPGPYQAEELFFATGVLWNEPELDIRSSAAMAYKWWFQNRPVFRQNVMKERLPVAVAVAERSSAPGSGATPRLVVFGSSRWISNERLAAPDSGIYFDLFRSCISWLRERPDVGSWTNAKERPGFALESGPAITRLYWLPAGMMFLGIVGFGGFVWLARRR